MIYKDINLRALEPEDLELLYKWENNTAYWVISNTIAPFSKFVLKKFISDSHLTIFESGQIRLMVELIENRATIGTVDIFDFDPYHKRAGIGILIADENYRRKGYALQTIKGLTAYCFNTLLLHQLYCNILSNNSESMELFKKAGFVESGIIRDWIRTSEGYLDQHTFQLINPEKSSIHDTPVVGMS